MIAVLTGLLLFEPGAVARAQTPPPTLTGTVAVLWGDPRPGSGQPTHEHVFLIDDGGQQVELKLDDATLQRAGGLQALDRKRVRVLGQTEAPSTVRVDRIEQTQSGPSKADVMTQAVTGNQRYVTILCRFGDSTGVTPKDPSLIDALVSGTSRPQINHFWREQ